jgi:hypothetical protein
MSLSVSLNPDGTVRVACGEEVVVIGVPSPPTGRDPARPPPPPITVIPEPHVLGLRPLTEVVEVPLSEDLREMLARSASAADAGTLGKVVLVVSADAAPVDVGTLRHAAVGLLGEGVGLELRFRQED